MIQCWQSVAYPADTRVLPCSQPKLVYMKGTAPDRAFPTAAQVEQVLYKNALTEQEYVKESSLLQRVQKAISEIARSAQASGQTLHHAGTLPPQDWVSPDPSELQCLHLLLSGLAWAGLDLRCQAACLQAGSIKA